MARALASGQRFYDLDALRSVAMLLGIILHATLFVLPEPVSLWPLHDANATDDPFYREVIDVIHGFRMPIFFLLSGFFTALLWQRRGMRSLANQRLKRVGIPLAVSCVTVLPASIWVMSLAAGGKEPYDFPLWVLPFVWTQNIGHLWFLWYLLLMVGCFMISVRLGLRFDQRYVWWFLIPISALITFFMEGAEFGSDTGVTLIPNPPAPFFYYLCFFTLGVSFYQQDIIGQRWWSVALIPAVPVYCIASRMLYDYQAKFGDGEVPLDFLFRDPQTLVATLFETTFAWLMVFGLMGAFRWLASRESFTARYMSDASYWMYLSHLPIVVLLQWLTLDWPIHYHLKFLIVCAVTTFIVVVTYQFFVRYGFIGRALNGPRTPRGKTALSLTS